MRELPTDLTYVQALSLIYQWVKTDVIDLKEFKALIEQLNRYGIDK